MHFVIGNVTIRYRKRKWAIAMADLRESNTVGRPRQYENDAEKVEAFRARQESAGYLRREVLVTRETAEKLNALAALQEVSTLDVGSALLELGLAEFEAADAGTAVAKVASLSKKALSKHSGTRSGRSSVAKVSASPPQLEIEQATVNPIQRFFEKRRESLKSK